MAKVKKQGKPGVFFARKFYTTRANVISTINAATLEDAIAIVQSGRKDNDDAITEIWDDFTMKDFAPLATIDMRKEGEPQSWLAADFVKALAARNMPQNLVECADILLRLIDQAKTLCDREPVQIGTEKETV